MHPNTPNVIARQRYRELLAEANAQRPGRLARGSASVRNTARKILRRCPSTVGVAAVTVLTLAVGVTVGACAPAQRPLHGGPATAAAAHSIVAPAPTGTPGRALASSCLIGTWRVIGDTVTSLPNMQLVSGSEARRFSRNGIYTVIDSNATFAFLGTTGVWNATMTWRFNVRGQQLRFTYVSGQGTDFADGAKYPLWFGSHSTLGFTCSGDSLQLQGIGWREQLTRS
jgi:hypothetical protein